jgi:hypothetical protein
LTLYLLAPRNRWLQEAAVLQVRIDGGALSIARLDLDGFHSQSGNARRSKLFHHAKGGQAKPSHVKRHERHRDDVDGMATIGTIKRKEQTMKTTTKLILIALAIAGLSATPAAWAQQPGGGGPSARTYNTNTVETLKGEVVSVEKTTPPQGRGPGVHVVLKTGMETIPVHLGPASYVEQKTPRIEVKDAVEVTGSRVTLEGKPAIIAASVKKGGEVLKLRDEAGRPVWAGGRGRRGPPNP